MSSADIWLTIALLAFATIVTRTSFFLLASARLLAEKSPQRLVGR